jgi:hypothetical protein
MPKAQRRPFSPSVHEGRQQPVALFKTSLRDWQSRYQTRRVSQAGVVKKVPRQAAPAYLESVNTDIGVGD